MSCSISSTVTSAGSASTMSKISCALALGHAGRRLVEQQHARVAGERGGDLEQPALAVGEQRDLLVLHVVEVELGEQRLAALGHAPVAAERPATICALMPSCVETVSASDCSGVSALNSWLIWKVRTMPRRTRWCERSVRDVLAVER